MTTHLTKTSTTEGEQPTVSPYTFVYNPMPGYKGREDASDHYLRHIRNAVVFLAVIAGIGVVSGIITAIVIAVHTAPATPLY